MSNYPDDVDSSTVLPGEDCPEMPDLKPCPFCGSEDIGPILGEYGLWWVDCDSCHACGPLGDTELEAITAWNRRVG